MQADFRVEPVKNFKAVFESGKRYKTPSAQFVFLIAENSAPHPTLQIGLIAMKKVVGKKAVDRNRCKRRLRHALQSILKNYSIPFSHNIHVVLLGNKNTLTNPWDQLISDIEKGLQYIQQKIQNSSSNES